MTNEFITRPEVDTEEQFTYYDVRGLPTDSKDSAMLYQYTCGEQNKFYVRTFDGQLHNPLEAIPSRHHRVDFFKVDSGIFNAYLQYLKSPTSGAFSRINRQVMYNL